MRWSETSIPTLRDANADLLERAGYARKGTWLPLGQRTLARIQSLIGSPGIFDACHLKVIRSAASVLAKAKGGEPVLIACSACGYASHLDFAVSRPSPAPPDAEGDPEGDPYPEPFHTPDLKTIGDIAAFTGLPNTAQMKSLVMSAATGSMPGPILALVRGDHQLSRPKLAALLNVAEVTPASHPEIVECFGAEPGSLGPVGVHNVRVIADLALQGRRNMICGANRTDYHLRNVTPGRDFTPEWADLRRFAAGDICATCGSVLAIEPAFDVTGNPENILRATAEQNRDEAGMRLPRGIAPFDVVLTPVNASLGDGAERICAEFEREGIEVLYDDRDERAGVKFTDADLIGIPLRVTLGKKLEQGLVELVIRSTREKRDIPREQITRALLDELK